jgi:hypothetical protein
MQINPESAGYSTAKPAWREADPNAPREPGPPLDLEEIRKRVEYNPAKDQRDGDILALLAEVGRLNEDCAGFLAIAAEMRLRAHVAEAEVAEWSWSNGKKRPNHKEVVFVRNGGEIDFARYKDGDFTVGVEGRLIDGDEHPLLWRSIGKPEPPK